MYWFSVPEHPNAKAFSIFFRMAKHRCFMQWMEGELTWWKFFLYLDLILPKLLRCDCATLEHAFWDSHLFVRILFTCICIWWERFGVQLSSLLSSWLLHILLFLFDFSSLEWIDAPGCGSLQRLSRYCPTVTVKKIQAGQHRAQSHYYVAHL